jgi:hypothetical protein
MPSEHPSEPSVSPPGLTRKAGGEGSNPSATRAPQTYCSAPPHDPADVLLGERYPRAGLRAAELCVALGSGDVDVLVRRLVTSRAVRKFGV